MNKKVPKITESVEEIKSLMKCSAQSYQKQRLFMLYHLQSGQAKNRKQVADLLGVHRTTIGNWLSSYETGGLEKLLERRYPPGAVPALTEEQRDILRSELQKPHGFISYGEIQQYIADTFGVTMKYKAVYALVHNKWKAKLKVPRPSHIKKTRKRVKRLYPTSNKKLPMRLTRNDRITKAFVFSVKMKRDMVFCLLLIGVSPYQASNL